MAMNKVQYQRGLSMLEFFDNYGSHEDCETLFRGWRWPEGFICPRCQGSWHSEFRRQERLYFQCSACRYQCSLVSGTVFESSKLPLPKWFLLAGTYHAFGFDKYAHRYLAQVQYLFNRRYDLRSILVRLARAACAAKPFPLQAVLAAELSC